MAKNKANGFKIEKGVPVPGARPTGYPWPQMKVGDSVFVPKQRAKYAGITALRWAQRHSRKFTTRREANGCRIWRIA